MYDQPQNLNFTWQTEQTFHFWWQHFCRCNHSHYLLHQNLFTGTKKHLQRVKEFLCPWPCNLCMHPLVRLNAAHTPHAWKICWASEEAPNHRFSCTHTSRIATHREERTNRISHQAAMLTSCIAYHIKLRECTCALRFIVKRWSKVEDLFQTCSSVLKLGRTWILCLHLPTRNVCNSKESNLCYIFTLLQLPVCKWLTLCERVCCKLATRGLAKVCVCQCRNQYTAAAFIGSSWTKVPILYFWIFIDREQKAEEVCTMNWGASKLWHSHAKPTSMPLTALTALGGEVPRLGCCSGFCRTTQESLVSYMTLKATDTIALPLLPSIITHMADVQKPMCHLFSERLC